jgi:hypothetical protein
VYWLQSVREFEVGVIGPIQADQSVGLDPANADQKRLVSRITIRWFLELLSHAQALGDGDILDGLIMVAINDANVRHLNHPAQGYNSSKEIPPNEERKAVSVYVIARELGLSYETTRRHVQKLIKAGKLERSEAGVILPARVLGLPETMTLNNRTYNTTRKMVDQLREVGMI